MQVFFYIANNKLKKQK